MKHERYHRRQITNTPASLGSPLSDDRFRSLLADASAFFQEAEVSEVPKDNRRQEVILEILAIMNKHGLKPEDLA